MNPSNPKNNPSPSNHPSAATGESSSFLDFFAQKPFFSSFVCISFFWMLVLMFFRTHYQFNDDTFVQLLFRGVGMVPSPSEMNQRENLLLCLVIKYLYVYFPSFQWYGGFLVLTQFLALWAIAVSLQMGPYPILKFFLFLISTIAINFYYFSELQWTTTASLAATGGLFLIMSLWREENPKHLKKALALAFVCFLFSALIRFSTIFLVVFVALPVLFTLVWKNGKIIIRWPVFRFLAATAAIILLCIGADYFTYHKDQGWVDSINFFNQHFELHEARSPVYDEASKPVFDSVGWTRNDLDMFQGWYFMDKDIYSCEKLQKLNDYFPKFMLNKHYDSSFSVVFSYPSVQIVSLFFLAFLCFLPAKAFRLIALNTLWVFLVLLFLMLYLKIPERIALPSILFLMYGAVFFAVSKTKNIPGQKREFSWSWTAGVVLLILLSLYSINFIQKEYAKNRQWTKYEQNFKYAMDSFHPQDDQLYTLWDSAFPYEIIGTFDNYDMFQHFNIITLAWFQRSPTTQAMMNRFGVKDLFHDLVDNPHLLLVCTPYEMEMYKTHMREKYNMEVGFEKTFESPFFSAYKILSVKS